MSSSRRGLAGLAAVAALALLGGCASPPAELFSTVTLDPGLLAGKPPDETVVTRDVEVRGVSRLIFWVPTPPQPVTLSEVVAEALDRGHGDILVNASVQRIAWYVPFLYGEYGWVVRGDVVRLLYRSPHHPGEPDDGARPPSMPEERPGATPPGSGQETP